MIDLSYLTEEEQEMIMTVLQRDAMLKRAEEERAKQLQKLPAVRGKIKYMTGEWFYEAKSQRHMDRIHGSDIIRASMNQKIDLTQSWTARNRAVSNGIQDFLSLPEPSSKKEEPPKEPEEREDDNASTDPQQERPSLRPAVRSSFKRHNPFNRPSLELSETPGEMDSQRTSGTVGEQETSAGESVSPFKTGLTDDLSSEGPGALEEIDAEVAPIPKKQTILFRPLDTLSDNDSPFPRPGVWRGSRRRLVTPRGILKPSTSWSSNDSGLPYEGVGRHLELSGDRLSWSSAVPPEGERTEEGAEDKNLSSLYNKPEKFSLKYTAMGPELPEGRQFGDQDLLDLDDSTPMDEERVEVEPVTGFEKYDGSHRHMLALSRTDCDQPQEEEICNSGASRTLKDSPFPLLLPSESKFGWMAHTKFPPYLRMPQHHRLTGGRAEAGKGEATAETEVAAMRWEEVCPPLNHVGQYETQADSSPPQLSSLPFPIDEKGKPVYGGMGSIEASPMLEVQSPQFIEGDSIAKVLEWFSRSMDSSDNQEEHVCQQEVDVETRNQPGASENDITKHMMIEDEDQLVGPKVDFSPTNHMAEYALVSDGSPTAEMRVSYQRKAQLERSAIFEEKDIACAKRTSGTQSPIEEKGTYLESTAEDPVILQHLESSSLKTDSAHQPKLQVSTVDKRPQSQKKENAIDEKEEHDRENKAILLNPVTRTTQQEVKQSVAIDDRLPQKVANMKSFWERGNTSTKILISRSNATSKRNEMEPDSQTAGTKIESKIDLSKLGQEVPTRPEETCSDNKNEKEVYGTFVSHSCSHNLAQDIHNKGQSENKEEGVSEPSMQSVLSLGQVDHREPELDPLCKDKPLTFESSDLVASLDEEKYVAKCIVIDEDMEIPISSVEGKNNLHKFPQKEEVPYGMAPLSRQVSSVEQSPPAPNVKQRPNQLDNSADKIRHLKNFWESEKHGPKIITGQPKQEIADMNKNQFPAHPACMDKNSTKSAFDHRIIASDDDYRASTLKEGPNFTVISMKQRMEKTLIGQSPSNFKNLCNFWDGTPSNRQNSQLPSTDRIPLSPKSLQLKGQESGLNALEKNLLPTGDKKPYLNPNYHPKLPSKDLEISNIKAQGTEKYNLKIHSIDMSTPKNEPKENKQLSPTLLPRQLSGSSDEMNMSRYSEIRPSMQVKKTQSEERPAPQEQQNSPPHLCSGMGSEQALPIKDRGFMAQRDPQQPRRPSLGKATGTVSLSEEQLDFSSEQLRNTQEEPRGRSQPPNKELTERPPSGTSNDGGWRPQPLARSIIPHGYHHYLGIPEGETFQIMPATKEEEEATSACFQPELELSVGSGPVRSSTPVVSDELQARRGSEGQYPWHSHHGTDGGDLDSHSETWSNSATSSACDEDIKSVKKALERAKLRPVSFSKSVEDVNLLATREEEESKNANRCDSMISMDDASAIPPSLLVSSFVTDHAQVKNLSKSVPAFLQKESSGRDSDSASEASVHTGRQTKMGSSLTNLSSSSGMSSVSGSVMSVYSGDFGNVEVRGTITFSVSYLQKLKEFHIFVVQCRDLAAVDTEKNRSNPYVKSYLLPDQVKLGKRKTSVKKKTLNPNFNEILRYRVRLETLKTQTLNLSVWHNDTFGRNSFLGEVELDLSKWDFGNTQMNNLTLKPRVQSGFPASDSRGEVRLALRFLPEMSYSNKSSSTGEVHIWVKDCKDLPIIRGTSVNPFVRCFVLPDTSRKSRQKTRILKRTQNPAFNHTMVYDGFRAEDLPEACVELTVWDFDHIASHLVGGVRVGLGTGKSYGEAVGWMDSTADEANLWERMMDSPNEWVDDVLPLRMMTIAKNLWK